MHHPSDLEDRLAIISVTHRYCWALDDRDWGALSTVFLPDATADLGGRECDGLDEITARCRGALSPLDASHHLVANHLIAVDGDVATSRCYLQAQHTRRGPDGDRNWTLGGRYLDDLTRTPDGWRIARRVLETVWTDGDIGLLRGP